MEKNIIGKIIIIATIIITSLIIMGGSTASICASNESMLHTENTQLTIENMKLKKTIDILNTKNYEYKNTILFYPTISPIKNEDFNYISDDFGWRLHPIHNKYSHHNGIDISAIEGTPIYSTAKGIVIDIEFSDYGYGNKIIVMHDFGFETLYGHLNNIDVMLGQRIKKNQIIGSVGNTGTSTGAHLHYEVRINGKPHNPMDYFNYLEKELLAFK